MDKQYVMVNVNRIDWKELKKQKDILYSAKDFVSESENGFDYINAIQYAINIFDSIQAQAAEELGNKKVFGRII